MNITKFLTILKLNRRTLINLELSRVCTAPIAHLCSLCVDGQATVPTERLVFSAWIVEAVYVVEDRQLSRASCLPVMPPYQFCLDGFKERLNCCTIIAVAFAGHRHLELMSPQDFCDNRVSNIAILGLYGWW